MRNRAAISMLGVGCLLLFLPSSAPAITPLSSFGSFGAGAGQMNQARGIAMAPDGLVFVADYVNNRIDVFSAQGDFIRAFGKSVNPADGSNICTTASQCRGGTAGSGAAQMSRPVDVAVGVEGNVFVVDMDNNRIDVFSLEGAFLFAFGERVNPSASGSADVCTTATGCRSGQEGEDAGSMDVPTGIGIDSKGTVYVANSRNNRIDVFSPDGKASFAFGKDVGPSREDVCVSGDECRQAESDAEAGAMNDPYDVAVGPGGDVAVTDPVNHRVDLFSVEGKFIRAFGKGVNPSGGDVCTAASGCRRGLETGVAGGIDSPSSIVLDGAGTAHVADITQNRISEFSLDGSFLRAFGEGVDSGQAVFEVCTAASGCATGFSTPNLGSIASPYGLVLDCAGSTYAMEWHSSSLLPRVERFGEPQAPFSPCLKEPPTEESAPPGTLPGSDPAAGSQAQASGSLFPAPLGRRAAKPTFKIELNKWDGTATLAVAVSEPGILLLRGKGIRKVKRYAGRIGLVELLVEATGKAKRKLRRVGKAKVSVSLTFTPDQGAGATESAPVTLKLDPPL